MLHYELTDESKINSHGVRLFRIRATRDLPKQRVKAGDVGGWLEPPSGRKPRLRDAAWVSDEAELFGRASAIGRARIKDNAAVFGKAVINGTALVAGTATVSGTAEIRDAVHVAGGHVTDNVWLAGDLTIGPEAQIHGSLRLTASGIINCYLNSNGFVFNVPRPIEITSQQHLITLSPVGSYGSIVSIVHMKNDEPYICHWPNSWAGTPEQMHKEAEKIVDLTADRYIDHGETRSLWAQHYRHIATFAETLPEMWDC
ncbi:hypothetical protein CMUST_06090 [Corynebacterium mustelae]|uniref:Polymer-forming cytoskeletal n=1 Tax=Corynebacterium mustelae TaxID=571915 RepID=A0A0G3GWL3_9CORY|nr:hypothetical protein [Corynebacterium mustelae]AKK05554.1 hypothetical protein CMUST_06090 [Corynebacterium mustelae]